MESKFACLEHHKIQEHFIVKLWASRKHGLHHDLTQTNTQQSSLSMASKSQCRDILKRTQDDVLIYIRIYSCYEIWRLSEWASQPCILFYQV